MFVTLSLAALIAANPAQNIAPSAAANPVVPATASAQAATPAPPQEAERLICVRASQTGSRVRARQICRTRSEWRQADARS